MMEPSSSSSSTRIHTCTCTYDHTHFRLTQNSRWLCWQNERKTTTTTTTVENNNNNNTDNIRQWWRYMWERTEDTAFVDDDDDDDVNRYIVFFPSSRILYRWGRWWYRWKSLRNGWWYEVICLINSTNKSLFSVFFRHLIHWILVNKFFIYFFLLVDGKKIFGNVFCFVSHRRLISLNYKPLWNNEKKEPHYINKRRFAILRWISPII